MREDASISNLVLGTECGASDRFSGITANPLIGDLADKIIYANGKAILSEIPEMLGVYDMFFKRFASAEVADKFQAAIDWYLDIAKKLDVDISNNLVPANVQGGLINSYIKSLGAVMKGGSTRIEDVINYGESANKRGLSIMQGPGNDLESITGLISSGANMIGFSTGYGTITGSAIVPVIKISSNTKTFNDLDEDIDFNAGRLLNDEYLDVLSDELLEKTIKIASGKEQSWPEKWKQRQFQIWTAGKLTL
jgi:altronate hydrolase